MKKQQEQLIQLLINNVQAAWEIDAVFTRCCIYYGEENALEECQGIIDFAQRAEISLLESFRLQVEVSSFSFNNANR